MIEPRLSGRRQHILPVALILVVYAVMTVPFLLDWPPPWPDESLFGEPSAVLAHTGELRSDLIPAFHTHVSWQPPLYFYVLAQVIRFTGEDLAALRMFSILMGGLILLVTYGIGWKVSHVRRVAFLAALLLILNPNFATYIKLVRMDGLCVLLQMGSLLMLLLWSGHRHPITLGAAALLSAAAVVTHPLGLIGLAAGCAYVLALRDVPGPDRYRALVALILPALILLALWILLLVPDHASMAEQLRFQFSRKARPPWESAANFVARYRAIPLFLVFSVMTLVVWIRHRLFRRTAAHTLIAIAAMFSVAAVALTFELPYHVYTLPWISLCCAVALTDVWSRAGRIARRVIAAVVAVVVLNLVGYTVMLYATLHWISPVPGSSAALYASVSRHLPEGASVLLQGYPDGYWILHATRPDLRLVGGVAFSPADKAGLRDAVDYAVIARTFEPAADSVALFSDLRALLDLRTEDGWSITAIEGVALRYHPSAWILRFHPDTGKGGMHEQR